MADAEFIVVCVDNSTQMHRHNSFELQLDAIKRYCKTKLDANPETEVVLFTMGSLSFGFHTSPSPTRVYPTSDYQDILKSLPFIEADAGRLRFKSATFYVQIPFKECPPTNKHKRMLFFC